MPKANTIGERLRWLRKSKHITLRQFAERVGCDAGYLSKLESGKADNPSDRFLMSVFVTYRVSLKWLRSGMGDPYEKWAEDKETRESLSDWSPERVARVMAVLDDLQEALVPNRVLLPLLADKSLEDMQGFWHGVVGSGMPVMARLFWNDAFMDLQFEIMAREKLSTKQVLTCVSVSGNLSPVKSTMANLLDRLNKATSQRGMKSKLAKVMGVPLPNISQWLSGEREPGGETTLKLLHWVEQQERK